MSIAAFQSHILTFFSLQDIDQCLGSSSYSVRHSSVAPHDLLLCSHDTFGGEFQTIRFFKCLIQVKVVELPVTQGNLGSPFVVHVFVFKQRGPTEMAVKCGQEVGVPDSKTGLKKIWAASLNKSKVRPRLVGSSIPW